jgi:hypothetical protein
MRKILLSRRKCKNPAPFWDGFSSAFSAIFFVFQPMHTIASASSLPDVEGALATLRKTMSNAVDKQKHKAVRRG